MARPERWTLRYEWRTHTVEIASAGAARRVTWTVCDEPVAERTVHDDRVVLDGGTHGAVAVRLPVLAGPARRVTWWSADEPLGAVPAAALGVGGLDLDPEPGSAAADREAWIRDHPRRYAARRVGTRLIAVLAALVATWALSQVDLPAIPWPQWRLPSIPWPSIPWPSLPWPDWSLPDLPEWVRSILGYARLAWPVLLAAVLVRAELRRRRDQDEQKRLAAASASDGADQSPLG